MQYVRENIEFEGNSFALHRWSPNINQYKGIIQIIHGMAEHIKRYEEFAKFFTEKGFMVFGIDNLGHGETVKLNDGYFGFFDSKDGWTKAVNANKYASKYIKDNYDLPLIIFGHSMGSVISRYYLVGEKIPEGIILSGVFGYQEVSMDLIKLIAKLEKALKEEKSKNVIDSYLMDLIYNRKFDNEGENSWISSVQEEVIKYNEDELCGFKISNQMFIDIMSGIKIIDRIEKNKEILKNIPILLICGDDDPVGNFGKDLKKLFNRYKQNNINDVKYKIYKKIRHEVIRDIRKDEVYTDIETWIKNKI